MIYDEYDRMKLYIGALPFLGELIDVLESIDVEAIQAGTYYTKVSGIKYMVQEYETAAEKRPEVHADFADVQLIISGSEKFTAYREIDSLPDGFDSSADIGFLDAEDGVDFPLRPGTFIIVFPYEPHTPGLTLDKTGHIRKIVAKIPYRVDI